MSLFYVILFSLYKITLLDPLEASPLRKRKEEREREKKKHKHLTFPQWHLPCYPPTAVLNGASLCCVYIDSACWLAAAGRTLEAGGKSQTFQQ